MENEIDQDMLEHFLKEAIQKFIDVMNVLYLDVSSIKMSMKDEHQQIKVYVKQGKTKDNLDCFIKFNEYDC